MTMAAHYPMGMGKGQATKSKRLPASYQPQKPKRSAVGSARNDNDADDNQRPKRSAAGSNPRYAKGYPAYDPNADEG